MRLDIKKKNVLALPKTASRLAVRSYKNISSVDFDVRPLQRIHYLLIATLVLTPTLSTLYLELRSSKLYALTKEEKSIVASTSVKKELIKTTEDAYTYNRKEELKGVPNGSDPKLQELLLSANKTDSTGKEPYQASLSKDPTKGLTFGDAEGNRQFTLTPNFGLSEAKLDDESRVVYPVSTTERSIYTFKKNGIKNDITLLEAPSADPNTNGTTKTYKYTLSLGKDLEARLLPSGDVGIYSADPTLFGNIQVGDQKSQELVDQARNNGEKNTLAFEIPKPFIIDSSKKMNYDDVSFKLEPNQKDPTKPTLVLEVRNLKNLPYPLSIDPTITVTTTSNFQLNAGDSSNVDFNTQGLIARSSTGSGSVGAAGTSSTFSTTARSGHSSVAYNGYLYIIGGYIITASTACNTVSSNYCTDVIRCVINSNGTTGTCTQQTSVLSSEATGVGSVVYNGKIYLVGGTGNFSAVLSNVYVCTPSLANGSLACTNNSTALPFAVGAASNTNAYKGWLYVYSQSSGSSTMQRCKLNTDGSLGLCVAQASVFNVNTWGNGYHSSTIYNGYYYLHRGGVSSWTRDIVYCPINIDGSIGTCTKQTNIIITGRSAAAFVALNGYMYMASGARYFSGQAQYTDVEVCPINADGSLGVCVSQASVVSSGRGSMGFAVYNNYLYLTGGCNSWGVSFCQSSLNDLQNIPITVTAAPGSATQQASAFTTSRGYHGTASYNGYIYITGGRTDAFGISQLSDIIYCQISGPAVTSPCTTNATGFNTARSMHASVAANGYLYIIGGLGAGTDIQYCSINSNGTVNPCSTLPSNNLPASRSAHSAYVYNGYLYVVGGLDSVSNPVNTIMYTALNSDGTLGVWTTVPNAFNNARRNQSAVAYNGYLYIIGGLAAGTTYLNDIISCPIQTSGAVGSCVQQNNIFTNARATHASVVYNGYLYIIGGVAPLTAYNDIQYCQINATTGSVVSCAQKSNAFTSGRGGLGAEVYNGFLYLIGGQYTDILFTTTNYNDIHYMRIGPPEGRAGTYTQQPGAFTTARHSHSSVEYGGYIYIVGGWDGGANYYNDIQKCLVNSDASVTCSSAGTFTGGRGGHGLVVNNGYIYIIGGYDGTNRLNEIQYCQINSAGNIVSCVQQSNVLASGRAAVAAAIYNGYIYVVGGTDGTNRFNDIQYCSINADGSAGSCTQQSNAFTTPRSSPTSVVYNGYIYVIGGTNGTVSYNDVQYCQINSNGSVGACVQQTSAFLTARYAHTTVAYNGYLYIIGGGYPTPNNDVQYCQINSNGSVGACVQQTSAFLTARYAHTTVVYNGYIYIAGGGNVSGTPQNDIIRLPISNINQSAMYETTIDTASSANTIGSFVIIGNSPCKYSVRYVAGNTGSYSTGTAGTGGVSSTTITGTGTTWTSSMVGGTITFTGGAVATISAFNSATSITVSSAITIAAGTTYVITFPSTYLPSVAPGVNIPVTATSVRYLWVSVTLNDSSCGSTSTITDIIVYFNDAPSPPTGTVAVSTLPEFRITTTDENPYQNYFRYKIELCQNATCSVILRTMDQTASQVGWTSQSQLAGTAYAAGSTIKEYAIHQYQLLSYSTGTASQSGSTVTGSGTTFTSAMVGGTITFSGGQTATITAFNSATSLTLNNSQTVTSTTYTISYGRLNNNTTYYWRAYAIDPDGSNTWSSASSIFSFVTPTSTPGTVNITGGTNITSGSRISP